MSAAKSNKVTKYRKPLNLNIGMLIFGFIFIYIIFCVIGYFQSEHIVSYEVNIGSLSTTNIYTGIAIREERVVTSAGDGYVNYFAREGERVGTGRLVYTIDGSGRLSELMAATSEENELSNTELAQLRQECISFTSQFSPRYFETVYSFKYAMEGTVLQFASSNTMESINSLNSGTAGTVNLYYSPESGIVVYSVDGYEDLTPEQVNASMFDMTIYQKKQLLANELLQQGDQAYKLCTNENWSLVIPLTDEQVQDLSQETTLRVRFLKDRTESWASFEILSNPDGRYGLLSFNNSMLTFCTDRFVEIELITEEEVGLKIPISSIVEKEFFLIPAEFIVTGDDGISNCVFRQIYSQDGGLNWEKVSVSIYAEIDGEVYVGEDYLQGGDVLRMEDSSEEYTVSRRGTLIGVYNVNKGYADFRQITILYQNDDYAIVKSNTTYGLSVYDHIVLDADAVNEDDFMN